MKSAGAVLHHGTMLVNSDLNRLSRYLSPSKTKLAAKGVKSASARVINLSEAAPGITVERVKQALIGAFGEDAATPLESLVDMAQVERMAARRRSWEFLYGLTPPFDAQLEVRLSFGEIQLHLSLKRGIVCAAKVYTDALDTRLACEIERALCGQAMDARVLSQAVQPVNPEVAGWLEGLAL
jgi:lipoate-protein ligase A